MECQELGAWVPITPLKVGLEPINGEKNFKDSNFIESLDCNRGFCDGKVEKVASSNGAGVDFGVETDESRCIEKEGQRVTEFEDAERNLYCAEKLLEHVDSPSLSTPCPAEKQNTSTKHTDDESRCAGKEEHRVVEFEDEERNVHCAEKLPRDMDSPSVSTPCPAEKQNSRKRHNDGIDLNKKPKQRPKLKKHRPKIAVDRWTLRKIPKAQTPRKSTSKNHRPSTTKNVSLRGKRYSGKSSNSKGTSTSENVKEDATSETYTGVAVSCKRSLIFECEAVDKCDYVVESCNRPHQYQFHRRSVEGLSLQVSTDFNMCPDFNTESNERGENCSERSLYQAGCLQFYRRTFRVNQCRQNSRKSGPNFPKIFKKSRTMRVKATTFLTRWSIIEGIRGGAKRKGSQGRCKQIIRNFCAQINWKIVRKGVRSLRKSKYQRPLSVSLLKMILPTEEQTHAAVADPESFKCVVGLSPIVKSRGKRSKGSIRRIIRHPLVANFNFEQQTVYAHEELDERETLKEPQLIESENYQSWRKTTSGFCNEDIVACDIDMEGPHHMKETPTQTSLVEVQLLKYENHLDCSLNVPSFFPDVVEVHGNKRFQPNENHLICSLNMPSFVLNDVEAQGNKRLQPDENHIGSSLTTPIVFLDDTEAHGNGRLQPENYLDCSLNNCGDVVVYQKKKSQPHHKVVRPTHECPNYAFVRGFMDINMKLKNLNINDECQELVAQDPKFHGGTLAKIVTPKKPKVVPEVALDSESLRMFKLMMDNDGCEYSKDTKDTDRDKNEWWAKEREVFRGRVDSFIACMNLVQGDRRFSKWKGSVVDSIVGVYLTQNVTDVLSSSAFINLAAKYPVKPRNKEFLEDVESIFNKELGGSYTRGADSQIFCDKCTDLKDDDGDIEGVECQQPCSYAFTVQDLKASVLDMDLKRNNKFDTGETCNFRKSLESEELGFLQQFYGENNLLSYNVSMELKPNTAERSMQTSVTVSTAPFDLNADPLGISREKAQNKSESNGIMELLGTSRKKSTLKHSSGKGEKKKKIGTDSSGKGEKKKKIGTDWEGLRKAYCNNNERRKDDDNMDAVDWEAVRNAPHREVSQTIKERGMYIVLAERIKNFLERVVKDHGKIDLEWLRDIPPDDAKNFLLSIDGIGLKSAECVRLLTLHHRAFPVDTNVARVAVRLGWVPLAPLPEELKLHLLESYPLMDKIQTYLFPRLSTLDHKTLYELHYQLITFGKVFCTKRKPNCKACPLKGECKHHASSIASSALPWHEDNNFVASDQNRSMLIPPLPESLSEVKISTEDDLNLSEVNVLDLTGQTHDCEPIIEIPESPNPECVEPHELMDIEDYFSDFDDEIPTIRLNERKLQNILETEFMFQGDIADALTALTKEAVSVHPRKLKFVDKLKTVHQVFELPDFHPLLEKFEERVSGDPCPYLLAIWPTDVTSKSFQHHSRGGGSQESGMNNEIAIYPSIRTNQGERIKGTILIPCRTANRGTFPLNGTYFQVNEVFADFESSEHPIDIPEAWIYNLPKRFLHCGTGANTLFRGSFVDEIGHCFRRGYMCLRGFDRRRRVAWQLHPRFHISSSPPKKNWKNEDDPLTS